MPTTGGGPASTFAAVVAGAASFGGGAAFLLQPVANATATHEHNPRHRLIVMASGLTRAPKSFKIGAHRNRNYRGDAAHARFM